MGIFKRISDIISANLNEMTEGFEDPEKMLKQAIREMDESIYDATQETAKVLANEKLLARELSSNEQQARDWQKKAEQAVAAGDDSLARKALTRKQEHQKLVTALQDQLKEAQNASRSLKHQLEGMQAKLSEAKRNLSTLAARNRAAEFKKKMNTPATELHFGGSDDAFAKFERLREKVERAEAEADALAELRGSKYSIEEFYADQPKSAGNEIDDELQALKQKYKT
jgi:phage shock protein A